MVFLQISLQERLGGSVRAAQVTGLCVWRINPFDGRSGLEDFIQNLGMGDGWRGAYSERF